MSHMSKKKLYVYINLELEELMARVRSQNLALLIVGAISTIFCLTLSLDTSIQH